MSRRNEFSSTGAEKPKGPRLSKAAAARLAAEEAAAAAAAAARKPEGDESVRLLDTRDMVVIGILVSVASAFAIANPSLGGIAFAIVISLIVARFVTHLGALMTEVGRSVAYTGTMVVASLAIAMSVYGAAIEKTRVAVPAADPGYTYSVTSSKQGGAYLYSIAQGNSDQFRYTVAKYRDHWYITVARRGIR